MEEWFEVTQKALKDEIDRTNAPVSGAKLRSEIGKAAAADGRIFVLERPATFGSFLASVPGIRVHRRPGRDILVVPVNREELLAGVSADGESWAVSEPGARLRADLFDALTRFPDSVGRQAFYRVSTDRVEWLPSNEQNVDEDRIALPSTSIEDEVAIRRRFTEDFGDMPQGARTELSQALSEPTTPLRRFTVTLQRNDLAAAWPQFRLRRNRFLKMHES